MTTLQVGSVFAGDFRVVRPLATGGMGSVFVVEQLSTHKQRALKIMQQHLLSDGDLLKRFVQEAKLGARIESEHVVEVHVAGVDVTTGYPYLVMELLDGEDLAHRVESGGPVPMADILTIVSQLAHALSAAHAAGVIHRDLKPENVFLAASKRADVAITVKILDFGIAKLVAEGTSQTGAMGSPLWLAPEQTEPGPLTPAADIWALGLLVFHMLTGRYFWRSTDGTPTIAQLLREVVLEPIPAASARATMLGMTLPPGFDAWFERTVCRDPARRFATATDAHGELVRCFAKGAAYAATVPSLPPQAEALQTRPSVPHVMPAGGNVTPPPLTRTAEPTPPKSSLRGLALLLPLGLVVALSLGIGWIVGRKQTTTTSTPTSTPTSTTTTTTTTTSTSTSTATSTSTSTSPSTSTSTSTSPSTSAPPPPPSSTPPTVVRRPALAPEGTLPEGSVERVIRSHASANNACFRAALRRDPTVHGLIRVRFYIGLDGNVRKVVDTGSTINDDEMRACVFRDIQSMHFSKPVGGEVPVDMPLRYEPVPAAAPSASPSDPP